MTEVECPKCGAKFYGWTEEEALEKYHKHWKEHHSVLEVSSAIP